MRTPLPLAVLVLALLLSGALRAQDAAPPAPRPEPVQVFLLAGQSNMEGQAVVDLDHPEHYNGGRGTLVHLLRDPKRRARLRHLRDADGEWVVRDDVFVRYRTGRGELKQGGLGIGYAVYPGRHHFGVELQFGHVVGDALRPPVLLIKTAWGGKSLFEDFRPPSAEGPTGPYYTRMLAELREGLQHLGDAVPGAGDRGYRIAGFVWFQGWNDMFDDKAAREYEDNLVALIGDLRRELKLPRLPVVIGETGNSDRQAVRKAQAAVARRPELRGTVAFVPTERFRRPRQESPNVGHGHHWFGNAESYFLIGDAMGRAMLGLLGREGRGDDR